MLRISETLTVDVVDDVMELDEGEKAVWLSNRTLAGFPAFSICGDGEIVIECSDILKLVNALVKLGLKLDGEVYSEQA